MLEQGGWYFDCDITAMKPLDEIEQDANALPWQLILRSGPSKHSRLCSDAMGCPVGWSGRATVLTYLKRSAMLSWGKIGTAWYPPWCAAWHWTHPHLFAVLPPSLYSGVLTRPNRPVLCRNGHTEHPIIENHDLEDKAGSRNPLP